MENRIVLRNTKNMAKSHLLEITSLSALRTADDLLQRSVDERRNLVEPLDELIARQAAAKEIQLAKCREDIRSGKISAGGRLQNNYILHAGFDLKAITALVKLNKRFKQHREDFLSLVIADYKSVYVAGTEKIDYIDLSVDTIVGKIKGGIDVTVNPEAQLSGFINGIRPFLIELPTTTYVSSLLVRNKQVGRIGSFVLRRDGEPDNYDITDVVIDYVMERRHHSEMQGRLIVQFMMDKSKEFLINDAAAVFENLHQGEHASLLVSPVSVEQFRFELRRAFTALTEVIY